MAAHTTDRTGTIDVLTIDPIGITDVPIDIATPITVGGTTVPASVSM